MEALQLIFFFVGGVFLEGLLDFFEARRELSNRSANFIRVLILIIISIVAKWLTLK